ncbi:MAG: glycosyltransferase [Candidatus Eisenbacteria bacterium]
MRICLVNTYHYRRGGDSTYTFDLAGLLEARGHEVVHFAMSHPRNIRSEYEANFVDEIDYGRIFRAANPFAKMRAFLRSLYSFEARAKFGSFLDKTRPDIVHFQNFRRHLTFSVVQEAKKRNIPAVFTAHDYDPICPNSLLFAAGSVCEVCRGTGYHKAFAVKCKEQSLPGTLSVVLEGSFVKVKHYYDLFDLIITPSEFARSKLIEYGFDAGSVETVHNFIDAKAYEPAYGGEGVIYVGRLAAEKGLDTLIEAAASLKHTRFMIAGDGPQRQHLENLCVKLGCRSVDFLGYVERDQLLKIVRRAMCVVMPSIWFENFPYSILESFALGTPVVASNIGGMPESVKHEKTGLLFPPGDALALSKRIEYLQEKPSLAEEMGRTARTLVETRFDPETHYRKISEVYGRFVH